MPTASQRSTLIVVHLFLVIASLGVTANLLVGILSTQPVNGMVITSTKYVRGSEVPIQWPVPIRTAKPWPQPVQWLEEESLMVRYIDVRAESRFKTTHTMQVTMFGWPLPVLQQVKFAWPWEDPQYAPALPHPTDTGLQLMWANLFAAPVGLAGVVAALVWLVPWAIGYRRAQQGRCVRCGYQLLAATGVCSECGHSR